MVSGYFAKDYNRFVHKLHLAARRASKAPTVALQQAALAPVRVKMARHCGATKMSLEALTAEVFGGLRFLTSLTPADRPAVRYREMLKPLVVHSV